MTFTQIIELFEAKKAGSEFKAICPAHADKTPSLSITERDGKTLLHCHAGCTPDAICAALGLSLADLFAESKPANGRLKREIAATYDYRDESGALLFQAVRFAPKGFSQRKPDGAGGWVWKLDGVRRVLYRLPELLAADPGATVFVAEGEKDVDRLRLLGLAATCNSGGAGKWPNEHSGFLRGRCVAILPDNDQPGRQHADHVARSLQGIAASVKVLALSGLPEKGDVSNWLDAGGAAKQLCALAEAAPEWVASSDGQAGKADNYKLAMSWADFDAETYPQGERIAFAVERGEIALLNALPNAGKTTLALNAVVSLAAGFSLYPVVDRGKPRRVLYVDGETRRPRLQRDVRTMTHDYDRETAITVGRNLYVICEAEINGESLSITRTDHLLYLSAAAIRIKPDVIVIDTLSTLCPVFNENDNAEQTRKIWRPLQKLARDCDAAILVLHHVGKRGSEEGQTPERVYRGRGASAAGGAARAVWLLIPDATTPGLSTLSCVKAKGDAPQDVRLKLDPATRWMGVQVVEPQPVVTPLERVLEVVNREMTTAEIKAALKTTFKYRAVEIALAEARQQGKLKVIKKGVYAPIDPPTARTARTAEGDFADDAVDAVAPESEPENRQPHEPQPPIGRAVRAVPVSGNKFNNLEPKPQNRQKQPVRLRAVAQKGKPDEPHQPHQPMTSAVHAVAEREVFDV